VRGLARRAHRGVSNIVSTPRRQFAVAAALYCALSVVLVGLPVLAHFRQVFVGGEHSDDPEFFTWALRWWPHAIGTVQNPLWSKAVWAPVGYNMAWAPGIPGPSLLFAPVTLMFGAVASYNLWALAAAPLAALGAFLLARKLTGAFWPSVLGGYVFGFSTYLLNHTAHINLELVFLHPLAVYLVIRRIEGSISARRFVALLTLVLTLQFLISTEVFASMVIFGSLAMVAAFLLAPREERHRLVSTAGWMVLAGGISTVVVSPYLAYALSYPLPNRHLGSSDLLSFVIPRTRTLIGGSTFAGMTARFPRSPVENGAYIGFPLLLAFGHLVATEWRRWTTRLLLVMFAVVVVATLGPRLVVNHHDVMVMPWRLVLDLPLLHESAPERYPVYAFLLLAAAVPLWLTARRPTPMWRSAVAVLGVVLLLPNSIHHSSLPEGSNDLTATDLVRSLGDGETVMILPGNDGRNMFWQSETWFAFRMVTGYMGNVRPPQYRRSRPLKGVYRGSLRFADRAAFLAFLHAYHVRAIVISEDDDARREKIVTLLGRTPTHLGHTLVFRVPQAPPPAA
jgi:hypothetical protein